MARTIRLSADHIDEIAHIMRLGMGLALVGVGWSLFQVYQAGDFSGEAVLAALGIAGSLKGGITTYLFEGMLGEYVTPGIFLKTALGFCLAGIISIFTGLWLRFFSILFAFIYGIPWLIGFVDAVPWVFFPEDFPSLQASIASFYKLAMTMLFLMLANIGPGSHSIDHGLHLPGLVPRTLSWDSVALQIRFGLAFMFLGASASHFWFAAGIYSAHPYLTLMVGVLVLFGLLPRISGAVALATIGWHLWVSLVAVKAFGLAMVIFLPQTPFLAAAFIFMMAGGGNRFRPKIQLTRTMWGSIDD